MSLQYDYVTRKV